MSNLTRSIVSINCWLISLMLGFPVTTMALQNDHLAPIHAKSDSASFDEKKGSYTYKGSVSIRQGSLLITADKVKIITRNKKDVLRIIATGKADEGDRAHFQQRSDEDGALVTADANKITYHVEQKEMVLEGQALLQHSADSSLSAELITYDIIEGRVNLDDGVLMVINPEDSD